MTVSRAGAAPASFPGQYVSRTPFTEPIHGENVIPCTGTAIDCGGGGCRHPGRVPAVEANFSVVKCSGAISRADIEFS